MSICLVSTPTTTTKTSKTLRGLQGCYIIFLLFQSLDGFAFALTSDGRFIYISETVSIYLGLSQVSTDSFTTLGLLWSETFGHSFRPSVWHINQQYVIRSYSMWSWLKHGLFWLKTHIFSFWLIVDMSQRHNNESLLRWYLKYFSIYSNFNVSGVCIFWTRFVLRGKKLCSMQRQ